MSQRPVPQALQPPGTSPPIPAPPPSYYSANYNVNAGTTTVIHPGNPIIIKQPHKIKTKHPQTVVCQHCNETVLTTTQSQVGLITWLSAGAAIVFGFWLGCCLIPFCVEDLQDTRHDCPKCHKTIDVYKPVS